MFRAQIIPIFLVIAALISYLNERFLKFPGKTGHFLLGLGVALFIFTCEHFMPLPVHKLALDFINSAHFSDVLIGGMLSVLLFAGGLHIPLHCLKENKGRILVLSIVATFLNVFLIAALVWGASQYLPFDLPFIYALVFGALISPTDPLSAMAVLTKIGLPKSLETIFIGESLFNDGIGLVLFTIFSGLAATGQDVTLAHGVEMFLLEVVGGHVMGFLLFGIVHYLIKTSEDLYTHTLVTLAAVIGGYAACTALHVSGPIAMAVFGLFAGGFTFKTAMSRSERHDTHIFWTLIDDIFNAVLFVLIGLQFVRLSFTPETLVALVAAIPIVLVSRYASVLAALNALRIDKACSRPQLGIVNLLTWGGLRGGLSIAMAFSLTSGPAKVLILDMTFAVVAFSILFQGLSVNRFFSKDKLQAISQNLAPGKQD